MNDCIFCKIIKGEIPSAKVYEDDKVYAFLDIMPVNPGHTLVIPKKHSENIFDTDDGDLKAIAVALKKVSIAVKKGVKADGINIGQGNGRAAGQAVFHLHFHIMPRFENDGLEMFPQKKYREGEMQQVAGKIKSFL